MSGADESVEERAGRNEALFRAVNNEIEHLAETYAAPGTEEFAIVCECGAMNCTEQIPILSADYVRVRTDPTLFLLVPGHEDPAVEAVVSSKQPAYVVARKPLGSPAEIAANTPAA